MTQQTLEQLQQEILDSIKKIQEADTIEQLIDELQLKYKTEGGSFVIIGKEYYTTTH